MTISTSGKDGSSGGRKGKNTDFPISKHKELEQELSVYPNPSKNHINIKYILEDNTYVVIKVYDINGKEVETLVNDSQRKGNYELKWENSSLTTTSSFILKYQIGTRNGQRMLILQ